MTVNALMPPMLSSTGAEAGRIRCPTCGASGFPACGHPGADDATAPALRAERCALSVLFCDLVDSTVLAARLDPEELHEVIRAYGRAVVAAVARFDGFVAHFMGDGLLACFGYPQARADDAERAVRAGLALVREVACLPAPMPLRVRIGIASGVAIVGAVVSAGDLRLRPILGATPNLAARLQSVARPGTLAISAATRERIGDDFECHYLGTVDLKGFADPPRTWLVSGAQ